MGIMGLGGGEEGMGLKFEMVISDIDKYGVMEKLKFSFSF
jgi:hypothetical protein